MEFQGLPLHILVLHLTVVLAPATAVMAGVYGLLPRTRRVLGWPLGVGASITTASAFVTAHFGEELEHAMQKSAAIEAHAALGDGFKFVALGFTLLCYALLLVSEERLVRGKWFRWSASWQRSVTVRRALVVLTVIASLALTLMTFLTGHSGAVAVWRGWRR